MLRGLLRSALALERQAHSFYLGLKEDLGETPSWEGLRHLIEEEEMHQRILEDVAAGRVSEGEMDGLLSGHRFHDVEGIAPLDGELRAAWGERLSRALADEEATAAFYVNLERMSKIPAAKRAYHVLAEMEREHAAILRRLLGLPRPEAPEGGFRS